MRTVIAVLPMLGALVLPAFAQEKFDSPDAAAQALIDGVGKHDSTRLAAIFGPPGASILTSGNPTQDQAEQSEFSRLAQMKHQLTADARNPSRAVLSIGQEDWPFPVPIVKSNGKWSFDASETGVEMTARKIGTHELDAIEICAGFVEAQKKFALESHDKNEAPHYASHMAGDPADALYRGGDPLVPQALADATWDGDKKPAKPYHGYYFRILTAQGPHAPGGSHSFRVKGTLMGGFGLVAWPAQYGVTGINTFIVSQDGVIYQKDITPQPGAAAVPVNRYDPDPSWTAVE